MNIEIDLRKTEHEKRSERNCFAGKRAVFA